LSPAPQALPQAAGFSEGLSAAPQAAGVSAGLSEAPQAAGVSAGLSEPPHAVPQAEDVASSLLFVHPNKFESAIIYDLLNVFSELFPALCNYHYTLYSFYHKYALFYYQVTKK
jgi:hypothetical protein